MKKSLLLLAAVTTAITAQAAPLNFDFKDPKGVNNVVFKLDAPLESINGTSNGITGSVTFDPAAPASATGKIVVATETVKVPNPLMQEHLQGAEWLNAEKNKEITFELKSIGNAKTADNVTTADATGTFTLNGVSKEITVPAKVTYLPGKLADRTMGKLQGDLLVIRANFVIKRSDYNIQPGKNLDKVADDIDVSLSIAGAAPKS